MLHELARWRLAGVAVESAVALNGLAANNSLFEFEWLFNITLAVASFA